MRDDDDDDDVFETYEEDDVTDDEDEWAARAAAGNAGAPARGNRGVAFALDRGGDEDDEDEDDDEDDDGDDGDDGDAGDDGDGDDARAGPSAAAPVDPLDRSRAAAVAAPDEFEEDEEEEDAEEMFDTQSIDVLLKQMDGQAGGGPAPYELLAARKREAHRAHQAAFVDALKRRGHDVSAADLSTQYGAAKLVQSLDVDRDELLAASPHFAAFLGAADASHARRKPGGVGRGRSKKPRKTRKRVAEGEAGRKMGDANLAYSTSDFPRAIELLQEVIRLLPNNPDAYQTLGAIYEETGNERKALDFLMIAAHLEPKDAAQWYRLAEMSNAQKNPRQALYCLEQALKADPDDDNNRWDQANLYVEIGEPKKAIEHLDALRKKLRDNADVVVELARVYHSVGNAERAETTLDDFMQMHGGAHVTPTLVNILAELKMEAGRFEETVTLIEASADRIKELAEEQRASERAEEATAVAREVQQAARERGASENDAAQEAAAAAEEAIAAAVRAARTPADIPLDLTVRLGMALLYLDRAAEAKTHLQKLRNASVEGHEDLWMDAAETCWATGQTADAEVMYTALMRSSELYDQPAIWVKVADCISRRILESSADATFTRAAAIDGAIEFYRAVLSRHPDSVQAKLPLAEGLAKAGRTEEAIAVLPRASELGELRKKDALRALALHRECNANGDDVFLSLALPIARGSMKLAAKATATADADAAATRDEGGGAGERAEDAGGGPGRGGGRGGRGRGRGGRKRKAEVAPAANSVFKGYTRRDRRQEVAKRKKRAEAAAALEDEAAEDEEDAEMFAAAAAEADALSRPPPEEETPPEASPTTTETTSVPSLAEEGAFDLVLEVAHALFVAGRTDESLAMIDECLSFSRERGLTNEQINALKYLRAHAFARRGQHKEAAESARAVAAAHPESSEAWRLYSHAAVQSGQVSRCLRVLAKITQVRSIQTYFTHRPVSTFDRSPFQLTDELFLYGMALSRTGNKTRSAEPPATAISTTTKCDDACRCC